MFKRTLLIASLVTTTIYMQSSATAATHPILPATASSQSTLTPDQQAQIVKQSEELARDSLKVAVAIDQGQIGAVWDKSSNVAKSFKRQEFIQKIFSDRGKLGAPSSRKREAITFAQSKGGEVPAGLYISISYATKFARKEKPARELISYHLDSDKVWRVSGYSVR